MKSTVNQKLEQNVLTMPKAVLASKNQPYRGVSQLTCWEHHFCLKDCEEAILTTLYFRQIKVQVSRERKYPFWSMNVHCEWNVVLL